MLDLQYTLEEYLIDDYAFEGERFNNFKAGITKKLGELKEKVKKAVDFVIGKVKDFFKKILGDERYDKIGDRIKCRNSVKYIREVRSTSKKAISQFSKATKDTNKERYEKASNHNGKAYMIIIDSLDRLDSLRDTCKPKENRYSQKTADALCAELRASQVTFDKICDSIARSDNPVSSQMGLLNRISNHITSAAAFVNAGIKQPKASEEASTDSWLDDFDFDLDFGYDY